MSVVGLSLHVMHTGSRCSMSFLSLRHRADVYPRADALGRSMSLRGALGFTLCTLHWLGIAYLNQWSASTQGSSEHANRATLDIHKGGFAGDSRIGH